MTRKDALIEARSAEDQPDGTVTFSKRSIIYLAYVPPWPLFSLATDGTLLMQLIAP
jgi:hypothetical protein